MNVILFQPNMNTRLKYIKNRFERQVAKGCSQTGNDLGDQPVQIGVSWAFNVQVPAANIVESFVIVHDGHISVLQQRMHAQDLSCWSLTVTTHTVACLDYQNIMISLQNTCKRELIPPKLCVVRFHNGCSDLRAAPNREGNFALLSVVHGQAFQHQATKAGSSTTTAGIVYAETLQTCRLDKAGWSRSKMLWLLFDWPIAKSRCTTHVLLSTKTLNECLATRNRMVSCVNIRPVQLSASLRILSNTKSTISLPMV